ncbi:MAG: anti-sigma factor [Gemmatimonadetes bacterium]|nr:anti-sigma factor [Gemmatimonadota bacterium]NNM04594.1 anti-sigma factor [Gemmatimonadota bacterium]
MKMHDADRLEDLLVKQVSGELSSEEANELTALVSELPSGEVERWELAAGELTVAFVEDVAKEDSLPAGLARRLEGAGSEYLSASRPDRGAEAQVFEIKEQSRAEVGRWAGWAVAAAAVLALVFLPGRAPQAPLQMSASELRESLLATDSELMQIAWTATEDEASLGASGDVVWSAVHQAGVMRFKGLQYNDPRSWQYQLWIFDAARNERYPVDGGVFDIPPGQDEVLVAIDPRLLVDEATLFAVTVERPGGVVVSDRERIVMVAQAT